VICWRCLATESATTQQPQATQAPTLVQGETSEPRSESEADSDTDDEQDEKVTGATAQDEVTSDTELSTGKQFHPPQSKQVNLLFPTAVELSFSEVNELYRTNIFKLYFYPRESEGICSHRRWFVCVSVSVCLSVTTITKKIVDGFAPNFMRRFLGEREDQVRVSLRSVEGVEVTVKKLRKPAIVYKIAPSGNSELAGCKYVINDLNLYLEHS